MHVVPPDAPPDEGTFALVVKFPDASPSFAYGFEAGGIWAVLRNASPACYGTLEEPVTLRVENHELYQSLASTLGYEYHAWFTEVEGWNYCTFTKLEVTPKPKLAVVKPAQ
jgi:hypothetical protein